MTSEHGFVAPDDIRARFSRAMSEMYQAEVPLYGTLLQLVAEVNVDVLAESPALAEQLAATGEIRRLAIERHGAIRVGTADELATLRRLFAVMGMQPVGYYDLGPAGVPVHSTAFRAIHERSLEISPFRIFASLLRMELIDDPQLRHLVAETLARRDIFTPRVRQLIDRFEACGGLDEGEADEFVRHARETFRWHTQAKVTAAAYRRLHHQHRLIADVVAFKGPHINHLTPRTLDIDRIQAGMPQRGIVPKAIVEGPPRRACPILLRQTSFKALSEAIAFTDQDSAEGRHTARFGEIEQRGAALTPKGRALYDRLLAAARAQLGEVLDERNAQRYQALLADGFQQFPDSYEQMRRQGLAYFRYFPTGRGVAAAGSTTSPPTLDELIQAGHIRFEPLVYEDFLPVSAAGIFQSNLGDEARAGYWVSPDQDNFQLALGMPVLNEFALYEAIEERSIDQCAAALRVSALSRR
ncbi:VOC family protein [Xanthomonas hyacinthi]|uniref:2-oxoadipate dioxygenase/decarboxylase n=1 Tax=Xanthomonas hyacinthi TaxID=56455 RepID=A0A2S7EXA3_9XANT|nr:VOC family protein [Xanthomonas hyacinthi]KLD80001.1 hypothetical protein Y886_01485 [Xanthomonas hyacinthi DSM 19077]PPU97727.1 DUF1338 domain-containing protein [Xanthomonas hyacinthi]QGY77081.1 VOC family protein [Xanthomonas hyacinthi]